MKAVGVIPAKNEGETIGQVLDLLEENMPERIDEYEFVVVSSSTDETDRIVRDKGGTVIKDGGTGLGEAMYRGLNKALEFNPDLVFSIDADLQFQPDELGKMIEASEDTDMVLGSRFLESGVEYDMSLSHRIGNKILTKMVNYATGLSLTDAQTGYRVMKPEVIEELRMVGRHTYVQETIIDAHQNGFSIKEVPVTFAQREKGGSRVVSSISEYAVRTLPAIIHRSGLTAYLLNGLSLLSILAVPFILATSLYFGNLALGVLGTILIVVSIQMLFIGMALDSKFP